MEKTVGFLAWEIRKMKPINQTDEARKQWMLGRLGGSQREKFRGGMLKLCVSYLRQTSLPHVYETGSANKIRSNLRPELPSKSGVFTQFSCKHIGKKYSLEKSNRIQNLHNLTFIMTRINLKLPVTWRIKKIELILKRKENQLSHIPAWTQIGTHRL